MKKARSIDGWVNPANKHQMKVYNDYWYYNNWIPSLVDNAADGLLFVQRTLPITPDAFKEHKHE